MSENSKEVNQWLNAIDGAAFDPIPNNRREAKNLYDIYELSHLFNKILIRMEQDLKHHFNGDCEFEVYTNKDGKIHKHMADVVNPTNHESIDDELYKKMTSVLDDAQQIISFPEQIIEKIDPHFSGEVGKLVGQRVAEAMIDPLYRNFEAVYGLITDSESLNLKEDYPARDAMRNLTDKAYQKMESLYDRNI